MKSRPGDILINTGKRCDALKLDATGLDGQSDAPPVSFDHASMGDLRGGDQEVLRSVSASPMRRAARASARGMAWAYQRWVVEGSL